VRARRRKELHYVEHKLVKVTSNELINFIKDQEAHFRTHKTARRCKECMEFLWSTTDDVGHILLEKPELLTKVTVGRCSSNT